MLRTVGSCVPLRYIGDVHTSGKYDLFGYCPVDITKKKVSCPVEVTLGVIAGRWKVMIIHQLLEGTKRFNRLQRELSGITHRTLAKQLREMEEAGLVERHDYKEIPPRVEYRLSPFGLTLKDILWSMHVWAEKYGHRIPR